MPGACECQDEAAKDVKCCYFLPSFMSFKILAWLNLIGMIYALSRIWKSIAFIFGIGGAGDGAAAVGSLVAVVFVIALLMILFSLVATCMFICCDSPKSRKLYAIALVLGGLAGVASAEKITAGAVL